MGSVSKAWLLHPMSTNGTDMDPINNDRELSEPHRDWPDQLSLQNTHHHHINSTTTATITIITTEALEDRRFALQTNKNHCH